MYQCYHHQYLLLFGFRLKITIGNYKPPYTYIAICKPFRGHCAFSDVGVKGRVYKAHCALGVLRQQMLKGQKLEVKHWRKDAHSPKDTGNDCGKQQDFVHGDAKQHAFLHQKDAIDQHDFSSFCKRAQVE